MRALYLLRHGEPAFPGGERLCLGRADLPLSPAGEAQAAALGAYFGAWRGAQRLSSPLRRCLQTAEAIGADFEIVPELTELDVGDWDGLPFSEIKRRWAELYRLRGEDPARYTPPGGETLAQLRARVRAALNGALERAPGSDMLLVGHSAANRALVADLTAQTTEAFWNARLDHGCVSQLLLDDGAAWAGPQNTPPARLPPLVPDEARCLELQRECETPERTAAHCRAVAVLAADMALRLNAHGARLDETAVYAGALLHDVARRSPRHAQSGALWLLERGYARMAALVGDHMDLPDFPETGWTEKALVFLADKLVQETRRVTLEERFSRFADDPERAAFARARYEKAKRLLERYERA